MESVYNKSLERINRGHTFEDSVKALELTNKYGLKAGAHFILGLPGESRMQMQESVSVVSDLPLHTIKFHQLQIVKNTSFAREYAENPSQFELFKLDEYIEFICTYLSGLNPNFIVERLAAETQPRNILSEQWNLRYDQVLQKIEKRMEELDLWQGKLFK